MKKIHLLVTSFCIMSSITWGYESIDGTLVPSAQLYRVQIGAPVDYEEANELKLQAENDHLFPVSIHHVDPFYKVHVGQLDNYPDADQLKDDVRSRGYADSFVVSEINRKKELAVVPSLSSKSNLYGLASLPPISSITGPSMDELNAALPRPPEIESMGLRSLMNPLKQFSATANNANISKGYAIYYYALACERFGSEVEQKAAVRMLCKVVNGDILSPTDYRKKAALSSG